MSFACPVEHLQRYGEDCIRVMVPLVVLGGAREIEQPFIFDTGAELTMVSPDVAAALGLSAGGRPVSIKGTAGGTGGRLVPVHFRFPPSDNGHPGLEVDSVWVVLASGRKVAILGFLEVHRHFRLEMSRDQADFLDWT